MAPPVATLAIPAPAFLVDISTLLPGIFILGDPGSILGGGDVLGDIGDIGGNTLVNVSVAGESFPPLSRLIVVKAGITQWPATGLLTAISGEVFAFTAGGMAILNCIPRFGTPFEVALVYNGRTNVFVGNA